MRLGNISPISCVLDASVFAEVPSWHIGRVQGTSSKVREESKKKKKVRLEGLEARAPLPSTVSATEFAVNTHSRLGSGEERLTTGGKLAGEEKMIFQNL